jgi:DNA mismatch repair ATPase MutS
VVEVLTSRDNEIFRPIAALWCVGTQCAFAVERWRARCGPQVAAWIDGIGEYEALCALGGYVAEHPGAVFPEVTEGNPVFEAEELAHPLLPAATAVANDVALGGPHAHVLLVSGSNMSGKSTLLRTVGIAAVMAQAGLPVTARRLRLSPLRPAATLRVQDSLQAGRSRFFAEVTRLGETVAMAKARRASSEGPAVLFLLDEVLSGTNSHDRRIGAAAVIHGLLDLGAIGLVTTHDLALTELVDALGARAKNVHFEDTFEGGALRFDFRLRDGVVRSSTALPLMRSVGLDV